MTDNNKVQYLALLRGVMPTGPNRIPKMSDLVQMLEQSGLDNVSSYIQSGNVICETSLPAEELAQHMHQVILESIGANLSIIVKEKSDLERAILGNPFSEELDCLYMYLPRDAKKKKLNNNFLEKKLGIVATTRKLSVIKELSNRMVE